MIRWACEAGFHTLDFGRTDVDNEGLRSFKRSWGASEVELAYTYLADRTARAARGRALRDRRAIGAPSIRTLSPAWSSAAWSARRCTAIAG